MMLLARREKTNFKVAAIHPPEFGHWRKAMLEDIAIATGGRVISRDLGGRLEKAELHDLGFRAPGAHFGLEDADHGGRRQSREDRRAPRAGHAPI